MSEPIEYKSLLIEGTAYHTTFTKKFEQRKPWVKPNEKHIVTVIPGTVREILVKEGQAVKAGELLFILEAMKMNNKILSPIDGVVKSLFAIVGKPIAKSFMLCELE